MTHTDAPENTPEKTCEHSLSTADFAAITQPICRYLTENVLARDVSFDENTPLNQLGVDSITLMDLVLFTERQFGITFPLDQLTPENTHSVSTLSHCLNRFISAAAR